MSHIWSFICPKYNYFVINGTNRQGKMYEKNEIWCRDVELNRVDMYKEAGFRWRILKVRASRVYKG